VLERVSFAKQKDRTETPPPEDDEEDIPPPEDEDIPPPDGTNHYIHKRIYLVLYCHA
jgi:hypothetical protein